VRGLGPGDFELLEEGVPREIELFVTEEETPLAVAFLLDVSRSMELRGRMDDAKRTIRTLVANTGPEDRFGLICFADDQVAWVTDFTDDRGRFLERLGVQEAGGSTALYDALAVSPDLVEAGTTGRKAILLLTDGLDTASRLPGLQAAWLARRASVPIYTVAFVPRRRDLLGQETLDSLRALEPFSSETGGTLFPVFDDLELSQAIQRILSELRFQYVIGFTPTPRAWDGSFHRIVLRADREELRVRTRAGYYATP
jgi:Ca-activated chloride channel family protein